MSKTTFEDAIKKCLPFNVKKVSESVFHLKDKPRFVIEYSQKAHTRNLYVLPVRRTPQTHYFMCVVFSYETPIAVVFYTSSGDIDRAYVTKKYFSVTSQRHLGMVKSALPEFSYLSQHDLESIPRSLFGCSYELLWAD